MVIHTEAITASVGIGLHSDQKSILIQPFLRFSLLFYEPLVKLADMRNRSNLTLI